MVVQITDASAAEDGANDDDGATDGDVNAVNENGCSLRGDKGGR